jgi:N-acetylmuramoyl-L-alanine amidase
MDLAGAKVDTTRPPEVTGEARFSQFNESVVRIVCQVDAKAEPRVQTQEGQQLTSAVVWQHSNLVTLTSTVPSTGDLLDDPAVTPSTIPPPRPIAVGQPYLVKDTEKETVIRVPATGGALTGMSAKRDKDGVYWVNIPRARIAVQTAMTELSGAALTSATLTSAPNGVNVRMELPRPMGVRVSPVAEGVSIRITQPRNASGTLASKTIVVDAGHGGSDPGAKFGPLAEKSLTLPIARLVAEELETEGTTVIMTREQDAAVDLHSRPVVGNNSNAHFFVSIHINSNGLSNSRSGTYTYYHFDDVDSRLLAECIQAEIGKVSGLPSNGAVSDRTVAPTKGFAVLRGSMMPAVLVEVAYINHATDRKLLQDDSFRRKIAKAIVRGIRAYIGEKV